MILAKHRAFAAGHIAVGVVAVAAALGSLAACNRGGDRSPAIATVNGKTIYKSEFDRFFNFKLGDLKGADQSVDMNDSLRSQMLDEFVTRLVVLDEAARRGLSISEVEIEQAADANPQMKSALTVADARKEFANALLVTKYYKQCVLKDVRLSPEEAQRYIDQHKDELVEKPGFFVREIRVDDREEADSLHHEVTEGRKDFAEVVRQHSLVPNAEQGGLSHYSEGQLPDVLEKAIQPLHPGDISPVIQSSFGFHIFKLESRTQPHTPDDRRAQVNENHSRLIEDAIERKNQEAVDDAVANLMASAAVKLNTSAFGFTYNGKMVHN
jgi:parvulin-like peptidyl-prolyl isomerase